MREDEEGEIGGAGERRGLLTRSRENGGARKVFHYCAADVLMFLPSD